MKKSILVLTAFTILLISCKSNSQEKAILSNNVLKKTTIKSTINHVSSKGFKEAMQLADATLVDVRTLQEYNQGHIENAVHIDWYKRSFRKFVLNIPKDKPILIYCRSGNRTSKTSGVLKSLGFTKIFNLQSGINEWIANKEPLTTIDSKKNKEFQQIIAASTVKVQAQNSVSGKIYNVIASDFNKVISQKDISLVDIRTPQEFNSGHIKGAINIDWYKRTFKEKIAKLPTNKPIAIYCRSGNRTSKAADVLRAMGFKEVINLAYGMNDWNKNTLAIER